MNRRGVERFKLAAALMIVGIGASLFAVWEQDEPASAAAICVRVDLGTDKCLQYVWVPTQGEPLNPTGCAVPTGIASDGTSVTVAWADPCPISVPSAPPASAIPAGSTLALRVAGVAGVPSDAAAVVLNMTVVNARTAGFATVYPCGQPRPEASNLNYVTGQTIPNLVIAKPGTGGNVCIYSDAAIDALADISGFFPAGSGFSPVANPTRVLDTRNGIG